MSLLLATDFDGTISDIELDHRDARIAPEILQFLRQILGRDGVAIAIVSGRDLEDLQSRTGALPVWYSGSHGLEIADPSGLVVRFAEPMREALPREWLREAAVAGLRLEAKRYGFAVHWRGVDGFTMRHPLIEEFRRWSEAHGLDLIEGRMAIETRAHGKTKKDALEELLRLSGATTPAYAGDDVTDFEALEWAAARGSAFFMKSGERPDVSLAMVTVVANRLELLDHWKRLVASRGALGGG